MSEAEGLRGSPDEHGTWEYTPGKGKTSSKPSFSGSILILGCNTALFPPIQLEVGISHQLQQHQQHVSPCQVTGVWCTSPAAQWRAVTWKRARSGSGEKVPLYSIWIICYPTGSYKYSSNQLLHTLGVEMLPWSTSQKISTQGWVYVSQTCSCEKLSHVAKQHGNSDAKNPRKGDIIEIQTKTTTEAQ